jgi:hypothetical protein
LCFEGLLNGKKEMARRQMTKQQAAECEEAKRNRATKIYDENHKVLTKITQI